MAENNDGKKKSGAGKFFLGALLGAAAGAVAGKAISAKMKKMNDDEDFDDDFDDECECGPECDCGPDCKCNKAEEKKAEASDAPEKTYEETVAEFEASPRRKRRT